MLHHFKRFCLVFLCLFMCFLSSPTQIKAKRCPYSISFVTLSEANKTLKMKESFFLIAWTSNGKKPTFKSSNSKIASVNTYGEVTAKRAGTVTITAKIRHAEAVCKITVLPTKVRLNHTAFAIENKESKKLIASTSNGSRVKWKTNKKSIATVNQHGMVTGKKPGVAIITATADGTKTTCIVRVKKPTIRLNTKRITLYRGQTKRIHATVSSNITPKWKINRKTVATISEFGTITALKHGTATVTVKVDGVTQTCKVIVKKPVITLEEKKICLKKGESKTISAYVSSGNLPTWSSSNEAIASIHPSGTITAIAPGRCTIYATEDGSKARCKLHVTE